MEVEALRSQNARVMAKIFEWRWRPYNARSAVPRPKSLILALQRAKHGAEAECSEALSFEEYIHDLSERK